MAHPLQLCYAAVRVPARLILLFMVILSSVSLSTHAQNRMCTCRFDKPAYQAYGTNGACGTFVYDQGHTCEVAFAGVGANPRVLQQNLGNDAVRNQYSMAPKIFEQYLAYEQGANINFDAQFIQNGMVVLERAALFRESASRLPFNPKDVDAMVASFAKENSEHIAQVFGGHAPPFDMPIRGSQFTVGRGYIVLEYQKVATVRMVFFTAR